MKNKTIIFYTVSFFALLLFLYLIFREQDKREFIREYRKKLYTDTTFLRERIEYRKKHGLKLD